MTERVLTLRELNRATLARQLLLERKRLSPTALIERLVGMQAQWPPAPYVGIWTRTTSFRREALERELARGAVVKATVMRLTLHLVTPRDYALIRAAMSETNFPWEEPEAKRLAPSVRALVAAGPVTGAEALAHFEREHGLTGVDRPPRVAQCAPRRARRAPPRDGALARRVPERRSSPSRSRRRTTRSRRAPRSSAATSPRSGPRRAATSAPGRMMRVPEIQRALDRLEPLRRFRDEQGRELLDVPRAPLPDADDAGARPVPAEVGQRPARVGGPDARAPGGVPQDGHPHERRRRADVPRGRVRRRHVARRERPRRARAVRAAFTLGRRELEDEAGRLEAFLAA